ncbi:MAG: hypothetical protein B6D56_04530 [Candidatus Omnitrophica bacterium 4484_70.1]|nr:MAG: hypothetical protein B6D56_04530 [Candidatus Omnitrophica bacterium 4484_70.1]
MEKEKILVVNGDEYVRNTLQKSLSSEYEVFTSASFTRALDVFSEIPFSAVLTEINTPEVKGIEILRKFKKVRADIPIIVITTYNSVSLAVEAMKAGAYDYITKPFNFDELKLVVMHALERQRLLKEAKTKDFYRELAFLDELTKVYNRRYFDEVLRREVERVKRYPQKFSLLMIDLDDFKKYNDSYGHQTGDKILKGVADILSHKIRRGVDVLARYGGEEFAIITPHTDKKGASVLAARLVDLVAKEKFIFDESTVIKVTVSIGVATYGDDAVTIDELVRKADEALYQAKRTGKNRVCIFGMM